MTSPVEKVIVELLSQALPKPCCRRAELLAALRLSGGPKYVFGKVVMEAAVRSAGAAARLCEDVAHGYGHEAEAVTANGRGDGDLHIVRIVRDAEALARQSGLINSLGWCVSGLPLACVAGAPCDAAAAWRGAFLARGSLSRPGRSSALVMKVPTEQVGAELVVLARRLGVDQAKVREVRGASEVAIRGGEAIGALLSAIGAGTAAREWATSPQPAI